MDPRLELLLNLLILLGMLVTLCGLIVPVFPGLIVIWLLALLYGIISGFGTLGAVLFVIITVLAILGEISDNLLMSKKARQEGARWLSIAIAYIAGIVGSIVFSPLGGIAAALGTLFLVEFISSRDHRKALAVTKGMAIGWGWAFVLRFGVGLMIIALWAIWAWA
ncbi:MAG: DUF456 domain-containing protein [Anaerolineales bacterium]|nr:DUF456 domain-containing protein [Anaerolineales bacterium]